MRCGEQPASWGCAKAALPGKPSANARIAPQLQHLAQLDAAQRQAVRERAQAIRRGEVGAQRQLALLA